MKIHELTIQTTTKPRKRVGRGIGSGYGKTAGRGTKGQNARTGGGVRPGFEGGQNPLAKRLPKKRGFASLSRVEYQVVNLTDLAKFKAGATVDAAALGIKPGKLVKLLGRGELKTKLTVQVHAASATAKTAIEAAGGKLELVSSRPRPAAKTEAKAAPAQEQEAAS